MRSLFITTVAFIGRIDGETRCAFWAEEPTEHGFDPSRLVSVDLALTPSAAARGEISWDAVQVDDSTVGLNGALAGTTIGPRWPEMQLSGVVLLEATTWKRLAAVARLTCPPAGARGHDYEYQTAVYWPHRSDPRAGRRYQGYHAEILETRGTLARVAVHSAGGAARGATPAVTWLDLASPEQCDVGPGSLSQIGMDGAPKIGALFLFTGMVTTAAGATNGPKLPPYQSDGAGPKIPPYQSDGAGPKIPPYQSDGASPKIPPYMGDGASPKLPPWLSDGASPKLPPWLSDGAGPKLPPWMGDSAGPKIPAWQGDEASPKLPIGLGELPLPGLHGGYRQ